VHDALGDALAIEVADLLEELVVLERRRPALADRALVLVVRDRVALAVGEGAAVVSHDVSCGRAGGPCMVASAVAVAQGSSSRTIVQARAGDAPQRARSAWDQATKSRWSTSVRL